MLKYEFWKKKKVHFCKWGYRALSSANKSEIKKNIIRVKFSFKYWVNIQLVPRLFKTYFIFGTILLMVTTCGILYLITILQIAYQ